MPQTNFLPGLLVITVASQWVSWRLKSPVNRLFQCLFRLTSRKTSKLALLALCYRWFRFTKGQQHDDVIKWNHFPRYWPFVWGIHRSRWIPRTKGQWRGALMFSLICTWINDWVNSREAGDMRRHRGHYDVSVMNAESIFMSWCHDVFVISVSLFISLLIRIWYIKQSVYFGGLLVRNALAPERFQKYNFQNISLCRIVTSALAAKLLSCEWHGTPLMVSQCRPSSMSPYGVTRPQWVYSGQSGPGLSRMTRSISWSLTTNPFHCYVIAITFTLSPIYRSSCSFTSAILV